MQNDHEKSKRRAEIIKFSKIARCQTFNKVNNKVLI